MSDGWVMNDERFYIILKWKLEHAFKKTKHRRKGYVRWSGTLDNFLISDTYLREIVSMVVDAICYDVETITGYDDITNLLFDVIDYKIEFGLGVPTMELPEGYKLFVVSNSDQKSIVLGVYLLRNPKQ